MIAAERYQRTQTETASKERVLLLLLTGARRAMTLADNELAVSRPGRASGHLRRAIDIVAELRCTLRPAAAPELCQMLDDVYGFVLERLHAALPGDRGALDEARRVFTPVAEAFDEAVAATLRGAP